MPTFAKPHSPAITKAGPLSSGSALTVRWASADFVQDMHSNLDTNQRAEGCVRLLASSNFQACQGGRPDCAGAGHVICFRAIPEARIKTPNIVRKRNFVADILLANPIVDLTCRTKRKLLSALTRVLRFCLSSSVLEEDSAALAQQSLRVLLRSSKEVTCTCCGNASGDSWLDRPSTFCTIQCSALADAS